MSSDVHALSGAYAVDALDEAERIEFERHLATCASCQAEVDSLTEAAGSLAALTETAPPPSLREAVLADIATVRPLAPRVGSAASRVRRRSFLVAAAAAIALGGGAVAWHPWESAPTTSVAQRVIHASDVSSTTKRVGQGATVTLYRSETVGRAVVVTAGMPAAPTGRVYELWLQDAHGAMHPAGLMPRRANATVLVRGEASGARGVGITVEPAGGSPVPTSNPIALVGFA